MTLDLYGQSPFASRLQWGLEGAQTAARAGHILVIVDVLVFSTSATAIVAQGCRLLPVGSLGELKEAAGRWNARELAGRAHPTPEGWSHSPASLTHLIPGTPFVYFSANGSRCCRAAVGAAALLVGGLVNARAVAGAAAALQQQTGRPITVVACGERWENDSLRPALEDELGAGAILAHLPGPRSAEAEAAAALFLAVEDRLPDLAWDCASGRELRARGYGEDVTFASRLNTFETVATADSEGWLRAWNG